MYNIEWDEEINGVKLVWASTPGSLAVPPRPVYKEELDLFEFSQYWTYPSSDRPLCWACERRYFYKGVLVAEVKGGGLYERPQLKITQNGVNLKLEPVDVNEVIRRNREALKTVRYEALKFILNTFNQYSRSKLKKSINSANINWERLAEMEGKTTQREHVVVQKSCGSFDLMPLDEAEEQGEKIVHHTNIQKFIVSFSGGKDSQVVLDLVSQIIPPDSYEVLYSDTGYEFPSSLSLYEETIALYKSRHPSLNFELVRNHQDIMDYWSAMGPPSRIHRWCCAVMKTAPIYRHLKNKSGLGKQPNVLVFEGVRAEESSRRATYMRIGKGVKHNNVINARPIFEWNSTEVYLYLLEQDLPINLAYKLGCGRVGCIICPYSSQWSENIVNKCFSDKLRPFLDYLRNSNSASGVQDIERFLNDGKWKIRGGSRHYAGADDSKLEVIVNDKEKLEVLLHKPKENFFEWLKTLGSTFFVKEGDIVRGEIRRKDRNYRFVYQPMKDGCKISFADVSQNANLLSHIMRVLNKTTYCVHCEACEVECPQGALSVVPVVQIDSTKCISCRKCLDFKEKGCMMAKSLGESQQLVKNMNLDRYNTFGLQEEWLAAFLSNTDGYFTSNHGLHLKKQVPALATWLREALLLEPKDRRPTALADCVKKLYLSGDPREAWQIIWVNLCYNSNITRWFVSHVGFESATSPKAILNELSSIAPERTAKNGLDALLNTGKRSTYLGLFNFQMKGRSIESLSRVSVTPSPWIVAYSLYRFAEERGIRQFTVTTLFRDEQEYGIHREFGIQKGDFEGILLVLQEQYHLLTVHLNMGLDNIILNEGVTSLEVAQLATNNQQGL